MADSNYNTLYRLTFGASGTPIYIRGTAVDPTTNTTLKQIKILSSSTGIQIDGGIDHALIDSEITGSGSYGVYMPSGGNISITGTDISGRSIGDYFGSLSSANLNGNDVAATTDAFYFGDSSNLTINNNDLHEAQYGNYRYNGGHSLVTGNHLFNNQVGAYSNVSNTTYRGNTITSNGTGPLDHGIFDGTNWDTANVNVIQSNSRGVRPAARQTVSFNRIFENQIGIQPQGAATLKNNLMVGNATGVLTASVSNVSLVNNTIVNSSVTGVRLQQSSSNVSLRNYILSTHTGTGLYVATDSQQGFASDFTNHYSSGDAALIWWQKPFMDVFDWQVESDLDRHSIGKATPDPNRDAPNVIGAGCGYY